MVSYLNSSISLSALPDSDWKNIFFSTISLIFAIVVFDGTMYAYEWKKKERSKRRLRQTLRPIFKKMHELWFEMAYHSMRQIMGTNKNVFSEEYKIEICKYLDLECGAPVLGDITWREYLFSSFDTFEKELKKINVLAFTVGWEELEDSISKYLNSGLNQNIRLYLYSVHSIPGGLENHSYLRVLGHGINTCFSEYLVFLETLNSILDLDNFDFYQEERLERIGEVNEFGRCRVPDTPIKNL